MRIGVSVLAVFIVSLLSCQYSTELIGAWALRETYETWKNGGAEGLDVNETIIGNHTFLVLSNSVIIDTDTNPKILSVPGGRWKIRTITKKTKNHFLVVLESNKHINRTGTISVIVDNDSGIEFRVENMEDEFKYEYDQSFLLTGEKHRYVRCDIVY